MKTKRHMSANIEGMLSAFKRKKMDNLIQDENGNYMSDAEARQFLKVSKAKGWKLIPCGDCEGFDHFGGGCPRHPMAEEIVNLISSFYAIELPDDYEPFEVDILKDTPCLRCKCDEREDSLFLPPGTWQFLFTTKEAMEEHAEQLVGWYKKEHMYLDAYDDGRFPFKNHRESLQTLLRSKGLDLNKNYAIIQKQTDNG